MHPNPSSKLVALAGLVMTPVPAAGIKADHCGSITSGDDRYRASFTFVRNADAGARTIRVFLCDRSFNCDTVFEAPRDSKVSMHWRANGDLAVLAARGSLVKPGTIDSIAGGRPPVRIVTQADAMEAPSGPKLDFVASQCRVEPPIVATKGVGSF